MTNTKRPRKPIYSDSMERHGMFPIPQAYGFFEATAKCLAKIAILGAQHNPSRPVQLTGIERAGICMLERDGELDLDLREVSIS